MKCCPIWTRRRKRGSGRRVGRTRGITSPHFSVDYFPRHIPWSCARSFWFSGNNRSEKNLPGSFGDLPRPAFSRKINMQQVAATAENFFRCSREYRERRRQSRRSHEELVIPSCQTPKTLICHKKRKNTEKRKWKQAQRKMRD